MKLSELIPDVDVLVALSPQELGGVLLEVLETHDKIHPGNFLGGLFQLHREEYPRTRERDVWDAFWEAWAWLEANGLIIPPDTTNGQNGWRKISRRGREMGGREGVIRYQEASMLPKALLHPVIVEKALVSFTRGEYDTAVFQAFKQVEIAVREAGGYSDKDFGMPLARKAFDPKKGPLSDMNIPEGEREGLQSLVAGALGSYKNPHSHRSVTIEDPTDAVEMIMLASHILRIVDSRL